MTKNLTSAGKQIKRLLIANQWTIKQLSEQYDTDRYHLSKVIHGQERITARSALLLEKMFKLPAEFWMEMQARDELAKLRRTELNKSRKNINHEHIKKNGRICRETKTHATQQTM